MLHPNFVLLYVANTDISTKFYADILASKPVETSPTFAMFALQSGVMLGLWKKDGVLPAPLAGGGGSELAFATENKTVVNNMYKNWVEKGLVIAQTPTQMEFGFTFVALDPDGHRLRVFAPS